MLNFGGTEAGGPANLLPFKTILPYLLGEKGYIIAGINLVGNIALLVPIGFLAPFVYQNLTWKKTLALAVASGLGIEGMQMVLCVGIFDIDDLILNALGVMIGYWAFGILAKWVRSRKYKNIIITAVIVIAAAAAGFYAIYPTGQPLVNSRIGAGSFPPDRSDTREGEIPQSGDLCAGTGGTGQIVSLGNNTITIKRKDGILQTISLTDRTTIRTSAGAASKADLKPGGRVTLVIDESQTATTVLICNISTNQGASAGGTPGNPTTAPTSIPVVPQPTAMPEAPTPPTGSLTPPATGSSQASADQFYIGETGHYIRQPFLNFWRDNGAYNVFGYPLSEAFEQNGLQVQLFDQALLEYHPNEVNKVQLGFLGKQLADAQSQAFPDATKNAFKALPGSAVTGTGERFFNETGHFLKGAFNAFWVKNGLLKFLGLPISEEINQADGLKVQYFERGRLEYNSITQKVDYSNSGDLLVAARGWKQPDRFALELQNTDDGSYSGFKIDQGRTYVVKLKSDGPILPAKLKGTFNNTSLKFAQINQDFVAFVPVEPSLSSGSYQLAIKFLDKDGLSRQINREVQVITHDYGTQNVELPSSENYLSDHTADEHDDARLAAQYQLFTPQKRWNGKWQWPLHVAWVETTNFAQRRILNGQLDTLYYHGGVDLAPASGIEGDPVYTAAPGKVVFVDQLEARGLSVVLDHGLGVTSYYFHLSSAQVRVGQQLKEGDLLGNVGSTGRSTGPHLHWEVRVQGIITDPRSFIQNELG